MSDEITLEETETKGRYALSIGDGPEAELTYSKAGPEMIIIDHTGVPEVYRGQGVGLKLVQRAVDDARAAGIKIMPLCPFAAAQFRRHPDWADVLKG
ncbi:MAG: GNAT family N-acetyltransferase [Pseudomonadota bacterium]